MGGLRRSLSIEMGDWSCHASRRIGPQRYADHAAVAGKSRVVRYTSRRSERDLSSRRGARGKYLNGTGSASRHGLGHDRKQRRRNWWPLGHVSSAPTRTSQGSSGRLPDLLSRACRSEGLGERRHLEEGGLGFTRFRGRPFELPESLGATLDSRSTSAAPRRPF